jgi:hypothetical protein
MIDNDMLNNLILFASQSGIKNKCNKASNLKICLELKAQIARRLFDDNSYYQVINLFKKEYQKALEIVNNK